MSKYTAEDFANAKFAEHPNGIIAARLNYDKLYPWSHNCDEFTDVSMARGGWVPVPSKLTITQSQAEYLLEGAVEHRDRARMYEVGISIVPDPKPTNAKRIEALMDAADEEDTPPISGGWGFIAAYLDARGVKAPEVDNG